MAIERVAVIGDPHGCINEFRRVVNQLEWLSLDEIWTVGDLVDRGPSSSGVIDLCLEKNIKSVLGNHDDSILSHKKRYLESGLLPKNPEKSRTLSQLNEKHLNYLESLPPIHVIDDLGLIIVHAGVWPKIPLYQQPWGVLRAQMIHPEKPGAFRWWGEDAIWGKGAKTEDQSRAEGWERWYRIYDYKEDIIFGHSTWAQPMIHRPSKDVGRTIGIDTGSCFGGSVTACVYSPNDFYFLSVKAGTTYFADTVRSYWEAG